MISFDGSLVVQAVVIIFLGTVGRSVWYTGTAVAVLGESVKRLWGALEQTNDDIDMLRGRNGHRECEHHPRRRSRR